MVWLWVSYFARFGASALFGGHLRIVRRPSWAGTLADVGVGLTQVQGRIINNLLNKKFVTPPCNGVGLSPLFVGGFGLWRSLGWSGIVSPWGGGLGAYGVWCFMLSSSPGPQIVSHSTIRCMVSLK